MRFVSAVTAVVGAIGYSLVGGLARSQHFKTRMNSSHKKTVLITGASSGIGYELAREFAQHGHDLVIVGPIEPELLDAARRLSAEYGVTVKPITEDLRREAAADDIFAQVAASGLSVEILVNNAGLGRRGRFWDIPIEDDISMIRLNVEAGVRLTKRFLPAMLFYHRGRILNTASVIGLDPGSMLAIYQATKAFMLSWSESLAMELRNTGVTLTVLCPSPSDTEFLEKEDLVDAAPFNEGPMAVPKELAADAYRALMDGDRMVAPGALRPLAEGAISLLAGASELKIDGGVFLNPPIAVPLQRPEAIPAAR